MLFRSMGAGLIINVAADERARLEGFHEYLLPHQRVEREWKAHAAAAAEVEVELPQIAGFLTQIHLQPSHSP